MEKQELDALLAELSAQLRELGIPLGKHIAPQVDVMVVVGSANSSNSVRLTMYPGPAAPGLLRLPGGPVHHPGVRQAAGGWAPAARHPSS